MNTERVSWFFKKSVPLRKILSHEVRAQTLVGSPTPGPYVKNRHPLSTIPRNAVSRQAQVESSSSSPDEFSPEKDRGSAIVTIGAFPGGFVWERSLSPARLGTWCGQARAYEIQRAVLLSAVTIQLLKLNAVTGVVGVVGAIACGGGATRDCGGAGAGGVGVSAISGATAPPTTSPEDRARPFGNANLRGELLSGLYKKGATPWTGIASKEIGSK